jgi:hypothetical protein
MNQEATPEVIAPKRPFPVLPTYKILALGRFTAPPTPEVKTIFPHDVPDTLKLFSMARSNKCGLARIRKAPSS